MLVHRVVPLSLEILGARDFARPFFSLLFIYGLSRRTKAKEGLLVVYLVYGWRSIEHALYSCCYAFYFYQKIDPEEKLRLLIKADLILGGKTE